MLLHCKKTTRTVTNYTNWKDFIKKQQYYLLFLNNITLSVFFNYLISELYFKKIVRIRPFTLR